MAIGLGPIRLLAASRNVAAVPAALAVAPGFAFSFLPGFAILRAGYGNRRA
jgi:hypothetical protein